MRFYTNSELILSNFPKVSNGVISALDEEEIELAMKEARQIYAELEEELKSLKKQIGHSAIIY